MPITTIRHKGLRNYISPYHHVLRTIERSVVLLNVVTANSCRGVTEKGSKLVDDDDDDVDSNNNYYTFINKRRRTNCGLQEKPAGEPAILISRLLLRMHRMYMARIRLDFH